MKLTVYLLAPLAVLLSSGCTTTENPDQVTLDEATQDVLNIAIGGSYNSYSKPSKSEAVLALALFKRTETIPEIIRLAKVSDNQNFRKECNIALGWLGQEEAVPYLKEAMKTDSYHHARKAAAISLEAITGETYLTPENGFESKEMVRERLQKQMEEAKRLREELSGKQADTAGE